MRFVHPYNEETEGGRLLHTGTIVCRIGDVVYVQQSNKLLALQYANSYNEHMTKKQPLTKKNIAENFLDLTEKGEVEKAFKQYVAEDFRHHNARFKGDRATMIETMKKTAAGFPKLESKRYRILEDGDLVAVHSHINPVPDNKRDGGLSYMHIFRFDKDKIVELWDFGQAVPTKMTNEHGMF